MPYETLGTQTLIDRTTTANSAYVGTSASGTETSDSSWSIKKITYDIDGKPVSIQWASGLNSESNVWDDRATYTYA